MSLVAELWTGAVTAAGVPRTRSMIPELKRIASLRGPCVPVGAQNAKTGVPSTYRPVGTTCPSSCPYLGNGCYAETGNVNIHQRRANATIQAAVHGAAVAMVAARAHGTVARLHVSGDLGSDGIDEEYVRQLCDLADEVNLISGKPRGTTVAWTYTHHDVPHDDVRLERLRAHGIAVRMSDRTGKWGAIVAEHSRVPAMRRETGERIAKCPAQLPQEAKCSDCKLCWERPDVVVAFDPHGTGARKARDASPN